MAKFVGFNLQGDNAIAGLMLTTLAAMGCGGETAEGASTSIEVPDPPAAGGTSGMSGSSGSTGQGAPEDNGGNLDVGGAVMQGAAGGGTFAECVGEARAAQPIGLDMYVVLDRSGSMEEGADPMDDDAPGDCPLTLDGMPANQSKWCLATHALAKYFADPAAANNRAALQYMPLEGDVENDEDHPACMTGGGITQAQVPLSVLPVMAATDALVQSLNDEEPQGNGTPIQAALNGIAAYTAANADPTRVMIGVFITDGDPTGCEEDPTLLAPILSAHLAATGLRTFIIGMNGATNANLQTIALAGGAEPHMDFCGTGAPTPCNYWNVGTGDPAAFVSALQAIQLAAALPCDFAIPVPPSGEDLDPELVNVTFTNELGTPSLLGKVNDLTACVADGWYYDNPAAPTTVKLCPATCEAAKGAGTGAEVDITFGCATVIE
jgi:Mg-chelatase subunit ChlD